MRPDSHIAFRRTLVGGPGALPPGLLAGTVPAQLRGMRAYANTISHARFVALEESFPRTRELVGAEAFHGLSQQFLDRPENLGRPIRQIGLHFPDAIDDAAARDLATVEWAWLDAHGAADAPAVHLSHLSGLSPDRLIASRVMRHPAARLVTLDDPRALRFEDVEAGDQPLLLVTRPYVDLQYVRLAADHAPLFELAARPATLGTLLELDPEGVTAFLNAGAFTPVLELL